MFCLVMEFVPGCSLHAAIHDTAESFSRKQQQSLVTQMIEGVAYLHSASVAHRDLKPHNMMLDMKQSEIGEGHDAAPVLKICDFGLAKHRNRTKTTQQTGGASAAGTMLYLAPEFLGTMMTNSPSPTGHDAFCKGDVYALSITVAEVSFPVWCLALWLAWRYLGTNCD